jgi:hypothetical protein
MVVVTAGCVQKRDAVCPHAENIPFILQISGVLVDDFIG